MSESEANNAEQDFSAWIGRSEEGHDIAEAGPIHRLAALLDHDTPPWQSGVLPPFGHWLYFLPKARQSLIGPDGHARRGGFLPPIALPRRMWAGGSITYGRAIPFGALMTRRSTIADIVPKQGASGAMIFVAVRHEIFVEGESVLTEQHNIVYRDITGAAPVRPTLPQLRQQTDWRRAVTLGPVELFRYSALTFNGHRIHYDRDYATQVEGYPGLVVHGPLIATLLVDNLLRRRPAVEIRKFSYRAKSPLFEGTAFELSAALREGGAHVWAQAAGTQVAMEGTADFAAS
jgi:3-methylfumaryl-CoA hydratase